MDNETLHNYKFMDTPEFDNKLKQSGSKQPKQMYNWFLNHFLNSD